MGNSSSTNLESFESERKVTERIDRDIRHCQTQSSKSSIVNLLLLGAESSDTSRILRQIEYQHNISTINDTSHYVVAIRRYACELILKLYTKSQALYTHNPVNYKSFNLEHIDTNMIKLLRSAVEKFQHSSWLNNKRSLTQIAECIEHLWSLDAIQSCWELVYSSNREMKHFMDKAKQLMDTDHYVPTHTDILFLPYSNISQISLAFRKTQIKIVTMNGSKFSKKWLHSFDHSMGIIFIVSLNDFDQNLRINKENALKQTLDSFASIVNDKVFNKTPVMLIFDEYDLFREKLINGASISTLFPQYVDNVQNAEKNVEQSVDFIQHQFMQSIRNMNPRRGVYVHTTSYYGNNVHQINQIFKDVQHIKLTKNLNVGGLL
eukprot:CAMPEP_0197073172 /NCGR_PEP_ID=MMETSP1384-20130603/210472_1 /TAXON_ID=29189 /ORGANISM="Ammonia sp." /LENGTH=376 /DNA_ID=CAMNT_0042512005 /DNA_START=110 /DNA_END=1240 /DNA_ORIENTATION=+